MRTLAFITSLILSLISLFLGGCADAYRAYDRNFDRSVSAVVDVTEKKVGIKYTLWGAKEPGKGSLSGDFQIIGSLNGKEIIALEK